jgi:hypothetical protein
MPNDQRYLFVVQLNQPEQFKAIFGALQQNLWLYSGIGNSPSV